MSSSKEEDGESGSFSGLEGLVMMGSSVSWVMAILLYVRWLRGMIKIYLCTGFLLLLLASWQILCPSLQVDRCWVKGVYR